VSAIVNCLPACVATQAKLPQWPRGRICVYPHAIRRATSHRRDCRRDYGPGVGGMEAVYLILRAREHSLGAPFRDEKRSRRAHDARSVP
jgi:hypothetical protein